MNKFFKEFFLSVQTSFFYLRLRQRVKHWLWLLAGRRGEIPHLEKQLRIINFAEKFKIKHCVETGTYLGEMVFALKAYFQRIISVELSPALSEKAKQKFSPWQHISIIHGDSGEEMEGIVRAIQGPCIFWLDAHYSGGLTAKGNLETPVMLELQSIFKFFPHAFVILVDDARFFYSARTYPKIEEILALAKAYKAIVSVSGDMIQIFSQDLKA